MINGTKNEWAAEIAAVKGWLVLLRSALAIAAVLLASSAFAAHKEAPKNAANPKKKAVPPLRRVATAVIAAVYSVDSRTSLLRNKKVQEDLKLDEKQSAAIDKTFDEFSAKSREIAAPIPGITPQERSKAIVAARRALQRYIAEQSKKMLAMLKAEQSKRLDQIMLQSRGTGALLDPKIAKELKITNEQRQKITQTRASMFQDQQQVGEDHLAGKVASANYFERYHEIAKISDQKILSVLSKEQQAQFEKMQGEKLELGLIKPAIMSSRTRRPAPVELRKRAIKIKPAPKKP